MRSAKAAIRLVGKQVRRQLITWLIFNNFYFYSSQLTCKAKGKGHCHVEVRVKLKFAKLKLENLRENRNYFPCPFSLVIRVLNVFNNCYEYNSRLCLYVIQIFGTFLPRSIKKKSSYLPKGIVESEKSNLYPETLILDFWQIFEVYTIINIYCHQFLTASFIASLQYNGKILELQSLFIFSGGISV